MLKAELVGLTAIEREDLRQLMDWRNDPRLRRYFREYREINIPMQEAWFEQKALSDPMTIMFAIRRLDDNELLGSCGLVRINWISRHAEISLYIGWDGAYVDNEGYAEESSNLLLDYGFSELNLNKIWIEVYAFDKKKKILFSKLGFNVDGVLRQNYFYKGKFWDSCIMSMLSSEWRKKKYKNENSSHD